MRLKSFPVTFKILKKKETLDGILFIRKPERKINLCWLITRVRNSDWTANTDQDDFIGSVYPSIIRYAGVAPDRTIRIP